MCSDIGYPERRRVKSRGWIDGSKIDQIDRSGVLSAEDREDWANFEIGVEAEDGSKCLG
jgi:hypothetical protein